MNTSTTETGNRQDGDDRRRNVPEEDQDDQADDDDFQQQFFFERVDGPLDQRRAVVGGDDLDALGQRRLDLFQLLLDPLDDVQGVLAGPHDDDAAHRVAFAVEVGDAAADFRSQGDGAEVLDQDRRSLLVRSDDDLFDVLHALGVAPPADHVLRAGELDQPPAHVVVAVANRLDDGRDRDVEGQQLRRDRC